MADDGAPTYPVIVVTDAGAQQGCVNVHDQATGQTLSNVKMTDYLDAIRSLDK